VTLGQPPAPVRRTCRHRSQRDRRRTGGPSTSPRPAGPRRAGPPDGVGSGCAPGSTPDRTVGTATPAPLGVRRSPPCRRPDRSGRAPPATGAEAEPGNSTQPQPPRAPHPGGPTSHPRLSRFGSTESGPEPNRSWIHRLRPRGIRAGSSPGAPRICHPPCVQNCCSRRQRPSIGAVRWTRRCSGASRCRRNQ